MKKKIRLLANLLTVLTFVLVLTNSCKKDEENTNTVTDIDGNIYHTVTIGTQVWMVENLKVTHYRNGDPIAKITDSAQWSDNLTGAYSVYDNKLSNGDIYGNLYNWYSVANSSSLCPTGWHVPTEAEWTTLATYLGGDSLAGDMLKESGTAHWESPNPKATNISGFTALPAGYRDRDFSGIGSMSRFWSSTENDYYSSKDRYLGSYTGFSRFDKSLGSKFLGHSVRCIKDK
jgi:uncharacterized protein (TIGR02145 family)